MGLDWNPLGRPKPGHEAEMEALFAELEAGTAKRSGLLGRLRGQRKLTEAEREQRLERFREITEPPFKTLDAPRVGFDTEADMWLRERLAKNDKAPDFETARLDMHGYYVLDLLPPCDGFPRYTHNGLYEGLDRYSFRAKFLDGVQEIIGPALHERAYTHMLARDLATYADELDQVTRPWAEKAGVAHIEQETDVPAAGDDDPASKADILFCAIRWCRFWASRGHGLDPWF
jgi:hypothetical protein